MLTKRLVLEVIPCSRYFRFSYILFHEWIVDSHYMHMGKGDLVLTDGIDILVLEVKTVNLNDRHKVMTERLEKVIRQAHYYALVVKWY